MRQLFGTAGIRGSILTKVTPELAVDLGLAMSKQMGHGSKVAIGHDGRTSSRMLEEAVVSGVLSGGCMALRLGLVPTPVLSYITCSSRCGSGVMVTASHNPPHDNGLKCYDSLGMEYTIEREKILEETILSKDFILVSWERVGSSIAERESVHKYISAILNRVPRLRNHLRVLVDCSNGPASLVGPPALQGLGAEVFTVNAQCDGHFPGRQPEPTPENLAETCRLVREGDFDVGFAYDGDADRLSVIGKWGDLVSNDRVIAVFAREILERTGGGTIVTSIDTSRCIDEVAEALGGSVERTRLGGTQQHARSRAALLAAEPWKIIDPSWGLWQDGIFASARILEFMDLRCGRLDDLLEGIADYPQMRMSIPVSAGSSHEALGRFSRGVVSLSNIKDAWMFDGVRVNFHDGAWLLVRASGTEPKIRIYAEARSHEKVEKLVDFAINLLRA